MKFLLDESADARLLPYLQSQGHDVTRIAADYPAGLPDQDVLAIAHAEGRILVANDRDFGELVFRRRRPHAGVILFRLGDYAPLATKIQFLAQVLGAHADQLDQFIAISPRGIRVRRS
jgi:predicted nuclease of predicted toxin-antitoxin system